MAVTAPCSRRTCVSRIQVCQHWANVRFFPCLLQFPCLHPGSFHCTLMYAYLVASCTLYRWYSLFSSFLILLFTTPVTIMWIIVSFCGNHTSVITLPSFMFLFWTMFPFQVVTHPMTALLIPSLPLRLCSPFRFLSSCATHSLVCAPSCFTI